MESVKDDGRCRSANKHRIDSSSNGRFFSPGRDATCLSSHLVVLHVVNVLTLCLTLAMSFLTSRDRCRLEQALVTMAKQHDPRIRDRDLKLRQQKEAKKAEMDKAEREVR
eukprot:557009-Rhodomonas_salina.3